MIRGPVRVGCVGAGYFSRFHRESWARMSDVTLVGVADIDQAAAKATGAPAFHSLDALLDEARPDILDIILPPAAHMDTIRRALEMGSKFIICQKPFCRSLDEAEEIVAQAASVDATLVVHENFRFMPWYRRLKEMLDQGSVGKVLQATFRFRPGDGQGPAAYLDRQPYFQQMSRFLVYETAVHWIDTFRYLFGNPTAVYADLRQINPVIAGEDAGVILFDFPDQVRALFDGNRHLDHASDNLRRTMGEALIEGTEGVLCLFGDGRIEMRTFGETESKVVLGPDPSDTFGGDCVHRLQMHVLRAFRGQGGLENTADRYCDVIRIKDAIYRSAQDGRKIDLKGRLFDGA